MPQPKTPRSTAIRVRDGHNIMMDNNLIVGFDTAFDVKNSTNVRASRNRIHGAPTAPSNDGSTSDDKESDQSAKGFVGWLQRHTTSVITGALATVLGGALLWWLGMG